jgi:hypothetical protein
MNDTIDNQLKNIQTKLQQMLKQYRLVVKENEQLKKQLADNTLQATTKHQQVQALQQQLDILKMGPSSFDSKDKAALEKKIDMYIKEIDRCLLMMNI